MVKVVGYINNERVKYEVDATQQQDIYPNWHDDSRGIRLVLTEEAKARLIMLSRENDILGTQPEAAGLLDYIRTIQAPTHVDGTTTYIYLEELYPEHEGLLTKYGVLIERK